MIEVWKPVVGFEGLYAVSNLGRVQSFARPNLKKRPGNQEPIPKRVLKGRTLRGGYIQYCLSAGGEHHFRNAHRLVAQSFLTPVEGKRYVNHKDGVKANNCVDNLEYCTMAENNRHAGLMNLKPIGTAHTNSKFTHEQLTQIRILLKAGDHTHKQIAAQFGVYRSTISRIFQGKSYAKERT